MKITVIGAGKTGRGFIGRLLRTEEVSYIDRNAELVRALREEKKFTVSYFADREPDTEVGIGDIRTWDEVGAIDAELILVSVGGKNLQEVGRELSGRISAGQRIIVAENASHPARTLYEAIGIEGVEIAESTVFCTTIEKDGLNISSEAYPYLQFDADAFQETPVPEVSGLKPVRAFGNFLTRKLYTYNSASCIIAYLGGLLGYTGYGDAANDPRVLALLDENYSYINEAMCREYGYGEEDQAEFALLSRIKFTDRTIADTVARNGREPQRKIAAGERIVGPLRLLEKYGKPTAVLEKTLAAALLFDDGEGSEWNRMVAEQGREALLAELCGIGRESALFGRVMAYVRDPGSIL